MAERPLCRATPHLVTVCKSDTAANAGAFMAVSTVAKIDVMDVAGAEVKQVEC